MNSRALNTGFPQRAWTALLFAAGSAMLGIGAFALSGFANLGKLGSLGGGWRSHVDTSLHGIIFALVWIALCYSMARIGVALLNTARRILAARSRRTTQDASPSVLYLRSFKDDESGRGTHVLPLLIPTIFTHEEQLAAAFELLGRFEAVGAPQETLPPIGAVRRLLDQDAWRAQVDAMMTSARLIVIRAGATQGLQWEIERVVTLNRPRDTMLLVPHNQSAYTTFARLTAGTFPVSLPDWTVFADTPYNADVAGLLRFTADWHPQVLRLTLSSWSLSPLKRGITAVLNHQDDLKPTAGRARPRRVVRNPALWAAAALAIAAGLLTQPVAWALSRRVQQSVRSVRPFSGPSLSRFVASLPLTLQDPIREELDARGPARTIIARTCPEDWAKMWDDAASRIDRLPDDRLLAWIQMLGRLLQPQEVQGCASSIHDLRTDGGLALLTLVATDEPRFLRGDARLLMQMLEVPAGSTVSPLTDFNNRSSAAQALAEFLQPVVGAREIRRYLATEPGPPFASNLDLCWFQHVWLDHLASQKPQRRHTLLRIYFYSYFPINWNDRRKNVN